MEIELRMILKSGDYRRFFISSPTHAKSIVFLLYLTYHKGVEMVAIKSLEIEKEKLK